MLGIRKMVRSTREKNGAAPEVWPWPCVLKLLAQTCPRRTLYVVGSNLVLPVLSVGAMVLTRQIVDGTGLWLRGDMTGRALAIYCLAAWGCLRLVESVVQAELGVSETLLRRRLGFEIERRILQRAAQVALSSYDAPGFYDRLLRAQREAGARPCASLSNVMGMVQAGSGSVGVFVLLAGLAWWFPVALVLFLLPVLALQFRTGRRQWRLLTERAPVERHHAYVKSLLTAQECAAEIRLYDLRHPLIERWQRLSETLLASDQQLARGRGGLQVAAGLMGALGVTTLYGYVLYLVAADASLGVGALVMYGQALERAAYYISSAFRSLGSLYEDGLYLGQMLEFIPEHAEPGESRDGAPTADPVEVIRFDSVSFRYPGASSCSLCDLTCEVRRRQRIAIVGPNGAGKSTMVKLLLGLYRPSSGRITVNGVDMNTIPARRWQAVCSVVFQRFIRFHLTVRQNIGFGDVSHLGDTDRIRAAAEISGIQGTICGLRDQWETPLGRMFEQGCELSEGQWQRLAIARAAMRSRAQVYVLDEPGAWLDAREEGEILERFDALAREGIRILVSHRLSTVSSADLILVLDAGRLVASGTHQELLSGCSLYRELYQRQASGYLQDSAGQAEMFGTRSSNL